MSSILGVEFFLKNNKKACDLKASFGDLFLEYIENYDYFGCYDIDTFFGDVNNFAHLVDQYGDEFELDDLVVKYDPEKDIHSFYYKILKEASGYIPSEKEKNDPRFKTALTVDVHPDSIKKNAKAFNSKVSRAGIPPTARPDGKF